MAKRGPKRTPEQIAAYKAARYAALKAADPEFLEKRRQRGAAWRAANPTKTAEYSKRWREKNPDTVKAGWARYSAEHRLELRAKGNEYTPLYKERRRKRLAALEAEAPGTSAAKYRRYRDKNPSETLWRSCKRNATRKGIPFNMEVGDLTMPTHCPVLGIELKHGEGKWCPTSPSVDRIIPELGYVKGNVLVVSWRANCLKRDATLAEMQKLSAFYTTLLTPHQ